MSRVIGYGVIAVVLLFVEVLPAAVVWQARHGLTAQEYQTAFSQLQGEGYRLVHISGYSVGGQERYAAIWEKRGGPEWRAKHGLTARQYQEAFTEYAGQGFQPVQICGYEVGGEERYAAIWEKRSGTEWQAKHGLTAKQYQDAFSEFAAQGYRPVDISGYQVGGQERYAAVWEKPAEPTWQAQHGLTSQQYQETFTELSGQGFRPVLVNGYAVRGQERYASIWEKRAGAKWRAQHGLTARQYQESFVEQTRQGYRPVHISGYEAGGQERYAVIWETE
jgi:hypothetical protein